MVRIADFTRRTLNDPRKAIAIYREAATLHAVQYPWTKGLAMNEEIADIHEYDLSDLVGAAASLRALRTLKTELPPQERPDYRAFNLWERRWLDAELNYLEKGRVYEGEVTAEELAGFSQKISFGAADSSGDTLGSDLNPYDVPSTLPPATRAKLLGLPAGHSMFLRTCQFAARLPVDDARRWLEKNDKAGFWRACLLALAAIEDRVDRKAHPATGRGIDLSRTEDGKPTAFALLGREFAKHHQLPKVPK